MRRLEVRRIKYIPLERLTTMALAIGRCELTNRVGVAPVCHDTP